MNPLLAAEGRGTTSIFIAKTADDMHSIYAFGGNQAVCFKIFRNRNLQCIIPHSQFILDTAGFPDILPNGLHARAKFINHLMISVVHQKHTFPARMWLNSTLVWIGEVISTTSC